MRKTLVAAAIAAAACQGPVEEGTTRTGAVFSAPSTPAVVVNECMSGSGGWIELGQTFSEIVATLNTELQKYDDLALTPWKFSPLAPLVSCGP